MMRAVFLALFVVPSAALIKVAKKEDVNATQPKSASPEGIELLWQRPHGEPKGILLYLHGCHGRATGMWTSDGPDGFHFDVCDTTKKKKCMGYTEEVLMRQKARKAGYVVAAVSGGVGSPRGCMNTNDVPRIQLAMKYLVEQEKDLEGKPVIMLGHSSGGRVLPELLATGAGIKNAKCIVPVADEIRVKGDSGAPLGVTPNYPEDVSAFFVHMERDTGREENVQKNLQQIKGKGVRTGDLKIPYALPVSSDLFYADGYGMKNETARKLFRALQEAQLLDARRTLTRNPYAVGNNWQEAFKQRGLIQEAGGYQTIQQYMDVAWSEHWMAGGRYLSQILEFCEKPGFKKVHTGGSPDFDLVAKVREVNGKVDVWKKQQEKQFSRAKLSQKEKAKQQTKAAQMGAQKPSKKK
eukprot:gnl/MRDRNA2_/MRDRNA2_86213_c0_seq1.p1 gnl/MRDRNA2_/MRDRNA2_86213_c0~~gnl/MRDRNA2_/MRDRNA2_86213_c0_seq1.p1  ORF type:complete len:433 (+),score=116.31 gnl/MRDRNA2_/MRDRNA2_86213_c0_seq1:74-1300(+)